MSLEIERKFLVQGFWRPHVAGTPYRQAYLLTGPPVSVRVRTAGDHGFITIKRDNGPGARLEFEYEIPIEDASELLRACCTGCMVEKTRYLVPHAGHTWEVDVFHGDNEGLVVAEIELEAPDETFDLPSWAGEEVTEDPRYLNSSLFQRPYRMWAPR